MVDADTSKITFNYNGLSFFIITLNEIGEIIQMETKRYMDKERLATWIIKPGNYKDLNDIVIPTTFELLWRLQEGDFSYAKFNIKKVAYNNPVRFQEISYSSILNYILSINTFSSRKFHQLNTKYSASSNHQNGHHCLPV